MAEILERSSCHRLVRTGDDIAVTAPVGGTITGLLGTEGVRGAGTGGVDGGGTGGATGAGDAVADASARTMRTLPSSNS